VHDVKWKNALDPGRPQTIIWYNICALCAG